MDSTFKKNLYLYLKGVLLGASLGWFLCTLTVLNHVRETRDRAIAIEEEVQKTTDQAIAELKRCLAYKSPSVQ